MYMCVCVCIYIVSTFSDHPFLLFPPFLSLSLSLFCFVFVFLGTFGKNLDYTGYGESQSYQFYQADSKFKTGDAMSAHCIYDTTGINHPTNYGVDHGDEMCAFIMFYYPANPKLLYKMNHLCSLFPKRGNTTDKARTIVW